VRRISLVAVIVLGLLLAACSTSTGSSPTAGVSGGVRQIQVTMSDDMRLQPAQMQVTAGETIEFVVHNAGTIRHELFLGGEDDQSSHEMEMRQMGGMQHDEDNGIFVEPDQSKTLRHVFPEAGSVIAGCHEAGHYAAGMKADISVE
jgi:uncharacterized cupredoxin-like copper-binding protein